MFDLVVVGPVFADLIYAGIPRLPEPGEEVYSSEFVFTGGGAFITAVAAKKLGLDVALVSVFGSDPLSDYLVRLLGEWGVDLSLSQRVPHEVENVTVSMNYHGDRAMLSYSSDGTDATAFQAHLSDVLSKPHAQWVHLPGTLIYRMMPGIAHQSGYRVSLDLGWDPVWLHDNELNRLIGQADLLVPNAMEAMEITGAATVDAACENLAHPGAITVVTNGQHGVVMRTWDGTPMVSIPAPDAVTLVDSTGAGDNFSAGMLYGLIRGYPPVDAARIGVYCGSRSVCGLGGNATSPIEADVRKWLAETRVHPSKE